MTCPAMLAARRWRSSGDKTSLQKLPTWEKLSSSAELYLEDSMTRKHVQYVRVQQPRSSLSPMTIRREEAKYVASYHWMQCWREGRIRTRRDQFYRYKERSRRSFSCAVDRDVRAIQESCVLVTPERFTLELYWRKQTRSQHPKDKIAQTKNRATPSEDSAKKLILQLHRNYRHRWRFNHDRMSDKVVANGSDNGLVWSKCGLHDSRTAIETKDNLMRKYLKGLRLDLSVIGYTKHWCFKQ